MGRAKEENWLREAKGACALLRDSHVGFHFKKFLVLKNYLKDRELGG